MGNNSKSFLFVLSRFVKKYWVVVACRITSLEGTVRAVNFTLFLVTHIDELVNQQEPDINGDGKSEGKKTCKHMFCT